MNHQYMPGLLDAHGPRTLDVDSQTCIVNELLQGGQASVANSEHLANLVYRRVLSTLSL